MRRAVALAFRPATLGASRTAVSTHTRDDLSRVATKVKEEANGQAMDVAEMLESARASHKKVLEALERNGELGSTDAKAKGKLQTLSASLKAYQNRLNNLQNEAKSINREAESLVKHLWGNSSGSEEPAAAAAADGDAAPQTEDFDADAPHISKILEEKTVEAEPVKGDSSASNTNTTASSATGGSAAEPEVLEIEIETPEEDIPITDITQALYEKGIDFSDCHDAASLRQRYKDMKEGKFEQKQAPPQQQTQQRAAPSQPAYGGGGNTGSYGGNAGYPSNEQRQQYQQQGGYNANSTTTETGLAFDPHPGAQRKMLDPMKAVWEVKQNIAAENGVDANTIDLWSGPIKLEDHKRLYDYGSLVQTNPIEVRQKGDMPNYGR